MNRIFVLAIVLFSAGCAKNAVTGRKQLSLVSNEQMMAYADVQYKEFLQSSKVKSTGADAENVKSVATRIAQAITNYYNQKVMQSQIKGFKWEYNLVENKEVNAWCMPGGKIVVYTGLLPVTGNNNALAVVLGHEIAHAIAEHGKERVSQQLLQQIGMVGMEVALATKPEATQALYLNAFGIASTYGAILPFSRKQELEADKLGLMYAAMAGYDPREAIPLWKRMEALAAGKNPPEFASTHPTEETRIKQLEANMPEAIKLYEATGSKSH
jgi:predicted Zn-dependent protease